MVKMPNGCAITIYKQKTDLVPSVLVPGIIVISRCHSLHFKNYFDEFCYLVIFKIASLKTYIIMCYSCLSIVAILESLVILS